MTDPAKLAERLRPLLEANELVMEKFVAEYEWDAGEDGYHYPTKSERILIADAIAGLHCDDDFVRTFNAWQDAVRGVTAPDRYAAGLEDAARVCDKLAEPGDEDGHLESDTNAFVWTNKEAEWAAIKLEDAAAAIRALIPAPPADNQGGT